MGRPASQRVAPVSALLTVGFSAPRRRQGPTVNPSPDELTVGRSRLIEPRYRCASQGHTKR